MAEVIDPMTQPESVTQPEPVTKTELVTQTEPVTEPVKGEYELKTEIDEAQHNLEHNLGELKEAILEKVDVKAKVENAIDEGKEQVIDYAVRAREIAIELYAEGRRLVRDRPLLVAGVLGSIALVAGAVIAMRRPSADDVL